MTLSSFSTKTKKIEEVLV